MQNKKRGLIMLIRSQINQFLNNYKRGAKFESVRGGIKREELLITNTAEMVKDENKEYTLNIPLIDRIFDNIPFPESALPLAEVFQKEINTETKNNSPLIDNLIIQARKDLLTTADELKPEVIEFLKKVNDNFSHYAEFTPAQKEQTKSSLIFSLAHGYLTGIQKAYENKYVGTYNLEDERKITDVMKLKMKDAGEKKLKPKELKKLKAELKILETSKTTISSFNNSLDKKNEKIRSFMRHAHENMKGRIIQIEQINRSMLENFIDFCISAKSKGLNIELEANQINKTLQLGLNPLVVRKIGLFQKNATTQLMSDQLLKWIGEQYPELVNNALMRWQKKDFISSTIVKPIDAEMVFVKAGVSNEQVLQVFDPTVRDTKVASDSKKITSRGK
jgi:hypothetical protein